MGPKKKGKANKLAKMSEEERIRYLQHRAAIEEEARRRKEQLISTFLKNKLRREEVFSRLNMAKINQQWRQTLRQIKCVELKQDLEDLYKWFDYTATKKNKIIEVLLTDLNEAESQYYRIHHCHVENIDRLIKIHGQRIGHYYQQYKQENDEIYQKANVDLKKITNSYVTDEENLQATLYRMEETCEEKISKMTLRHYSKVDELRNDMLTEMENLNNSRELQIEKIWQNFEMILKQYWEQTEDRRRQYLLMRETDHENCKQIFENNLQMNAVIDIIIDLKDKLSKAEAVSTERFLECKANKENTRQFLFSLKKKVNEEIDMDKKNLNFMNTIASKTTEELKRILTKGEEILQLQTLCRKFETLNEKICSEGFDKPQLTEEEEREVEEEFKHYTEPLAKEAYSDILNLGGFWKRFNRVLLEKEALVLHHQSLLNEQKRLTNLLKNYVSDIVVKQPESKVSYANGVQTCKQRPFTSFPVSRKNSLSTVSFTEATQSPSIRQIISAQMKKSQKVNF